MDGIRYTGDENYILFDLQPLGVLILTLKMKIKTGYWSKMGTAYFITGIYGPTQSYKCFTQGEFRQQLDMYKQLRNRLKTSRTFEAEGTED